MSIALVEGSSGQGAPEGMSVSNTDEVHPLVSSISDGSARAVDE